MVCDWNYCCQGNALIWLHCRHCCVSNRCLLFLVCFVAGCCVFKYLCLCVCVCVCLQVGVADYSNWLSSSPDPNHLINSAGLIALITRLFLPTCGNVLSWPRNWLLFCSPHFSPYLCHTTPFSLPACPLPSSTRLPLHLPSLFCVVHKNTILLYNYQQVCVCSWVHYTET